MARDDTTAPIDLGTGRHLTLRGRAREAKPEPDSPREPNPRTASELIQQTVDDVLTVARTEKPDASQVARLGDNVKLLAKLAEAGIAASTRGGGKGNSWVALAFTILAALGITISGPAISSADDIAAAKISSEHNAAEIIEVKARQDRLETEKAEIERDNRRALGLTIRWLGDEQARHCEHSEAIAAGVNWLGKRESARSRDPDAEFAPIKIDCRASRLMPPELELLRGAAPYDPRSQH